MNVLDGPKRDLRRVVHGGRLRGCRVDGDRLVLDDGRSIAEADAVYASPVDPATIVCVHLNYRSRAVEFGVDLIGGHPTYFMKPVTSINAHRGQLVRAADCSLMNYEGEIAAVVGRAMRGVRPEDVWDHLAGFACSNDVGAHDFRDTDAGSMLRVKGQDGFCPIGPGIVSGVDIRRSRLRTYVNGQKVQEGSVSEMVWGIDELFADITRHITLRPGDVVLTGTPWHSRPVFPGDSVEVEVDGVGRLLNTVVEAPAPDNRRGFPATVTKTSLSVALGSDYHVLKQHQQVPSADQYRAARGDLIARNMASGPPPRSPR
ncbi:MAG: fumarylacetoacetate hydrolase family protein [Polyangiaceae bacterium]|jgi:5-oxopent-3-ene-1,2,5-tricarboxylate decarboxylase / 2-hydroxyhepta-2,4-diene-1,7-dioate isomerase